MTNLIKTPGFELAVYQQGKSNAKKLAIVIPGRLDTKDYPHMKSHVNFLAEKGYLAVSFDPPGTWESKGNIELHTTTNIIKAVNELIEHFGNKPTLLLGHSRGGAVAILCAAVNQHVKGIVAIMSSYDSPSPPSKEAVQKGFQVSYRDDPNDSTKQKKFELPIKYFEDGKKYNPTNALIHNTKPKLIIYGTNDEFYTPSQIKEIYKKIPEPKQLYELKSDHDYRYYPKLIEEVNHVIGKFLAKLV